MSEQPVRIVHMRCRRGHWVGSKKKRRLFSDLWLRLGIATAISRILGKPKES